MRRCEVDISRLEEEEGSSSADEEIITTLVVPSATEECDHCYLSKQKDIFRQVLKFLGEDTCRQGIVKTPARYAKAMAQMLSGYGKTAESILGDAIFNEECLYGKRQSVCVGNIEFYSTDINTLLPFFGEVHICYLPAHGNVAGLSKFARIVEAFSKRLQTPQTLAKNIACSIEDLLRPQGLFVVVQSMHLTHETVGWLGEAGRRSDFTDVYVEAKGAFLSNTSSSPPFSEEALEMLALMDISMEVNRKPDLGLETSQAAGIEMSGSGNGSLAVASTSGKRHYSVENCFAGGLNEFLGTKREFFTEKENSIKNLIYQIYDKSSDLNRSSTNVSRDVLWNAASRYANWLLQMTSGSYYAMDYVLQLVRTNPQIHQSVHRSAGNDRAFATYRRERLHFCELFTSVGSICEHHILPFFGKIYISLVKDESQVNVSMEELEAILWKYSRQLQLQERLATQVADALEKFFPHLDGVFVCMSAYHHCMRARGAEKTSAKTLSVIKRGIYEDDQALSMECIKRFHGMNCEKSVLTCQRC